MNEKKLELIKKILFIKKISISDSYKLNYSYLKLLNLKKLNLIINQLKDILE